MNTLMKLLPGALLVSLFMTAPVLAAGGDAEKGKIVYEKRCIWCHGAEGDGLGAAEKFLNPPPRNFEDVLI